MLAIGVDRCALQGPGRGFSLGLNPELAGLGDRDAGAVRGVDARADLDVGRRREIVGRLLLREGLEPPLAGLVDIVDDPRLFLDAL